MEGQTVPTRRLADRDTAERLMRFRLIVFPGLAGAAIGGMVAVFLVKREQVPIGLAILAVPAAAAICSAMGLAAWWAIARVGTGFVGMVTASGGERGPTTFSLEQSLIARGRFAEAADRYRAHVRDNAADAVAAMSLAALLAKHLGEPAEAERLYQGVRDRSPDPNQQFEAANALIDLYRATGQRGRHLAELARFAHHYRSMQAGAAAKRELARLKEADR